jgi:hypothetical protein
MMPNLRLAGTPTRNPNAILTSSCRSTGTELVLQANASLGHDEI